MWNAPIFFVDRGGIRIECDPVHAAPVVEVDFLFDEEFGKHVPINCVPAARTRCLALIDTGADQNAADPVMISKYKCPVTERIHAQGATSTQATTFHKAHLFFPPKGPYYEMGFVNAPLRANGRPYDLIIGRRFLQFCRLIFDIPNSDFRLEVVANPAAR